MFAGPTDGTDAIGGEAPCGGEVNGKRAGPGPVARRTPNQRVLFRIGRDGLRKTGCNGA
jgi:hypothetical protein